MHRNSQKRFYGTDLIYALTANTKNRHPYFESASYCESWLTDLIVCKQIKTFKLFAFCLLYDHFHLLLQPINPAHNITEIMRSFKANSSRNINKNCLGFSQLGFQWHESFHDHVIRNSRDYNNQFNYISFNYQKHMLPADWKYTSLNHGYLLDDAPF